MPRAIPFRAGFSKMRWWPHDRPKASANGNNLLGIAYAKSAEMADTLQNSGTAKRLPMTGEFGWQGGVIARTSTGYVIVAFSGGKSEDDVQVSTPVLKCSKARCRFRTWPMPFCGYPPIRLAQLAAHRQRFFPFFG